MAGDEAVRLFAQCLDHNWVRVAKRSDTYASRAVEVLPSGGIPDAGSFAADEDDRALVVHPGRMSVLTLNDLLRHQ